ncbi:peptidase inhibitor family I36 protein [Salinispora mooreana]|uniref:peptidase inhibitor family I36 protein n=1 Tax=Salinispora mooreana TaxID=999545 RepID=UPI00036CD304|nr:peptidase inhibitor family I36 protein [Salinispora mooreana]
MSKRLLRFLLAAIAAISVLALASAPTHADPASTTAKTSGISVALQSLMELYPGSEVVSEDTLRIAPGILLSMPADQPRDKRVLSKEAVKKALASPNPVRAAAPAEPASRVSKPTEGSALLADGPTIKDCAFYYLCLYADANQWGYKIRFYDCKFVDLGTINFPLGGKWNDKMTSYINNQTRGTVSHFYNWDGTSQWIKLWSDTALGYSDQVLYDNKVDAVRVC